MVADPSRTESHARVNGRRPDAQLAQWILYLTLSTALGLAWTGFYLLIACTFLFMGDRLFGILEQILPTALGASFCAGLLYRLVSLVKARPLSDWFAGIIPGIGAAFFVLFSDVSYYAPHGEESFLNRLIPTVFLTYLCGGIVLIPLSIPHKRALQRLHQWLTEWAPVASVRSARHVLYATACAGILLGTELPRHFDRKAHEYAHYVGGFYGVDMPPTAYLLSSRHFDDPEPYAPQQDAHFHMQGKMHWPPVEEVREMTRTESARDVRKRFFEVSGQTVPLSAHLDQVKWHEPGGWVIVASRLRTAEADYVEFRRF